MPNWCVGELKVRGKYKDIKNFLKNEIIDRGVISWNEELEKFIEIRKSLIIKEEDGLFVITNEEDSDGEEELYLLGTDRCYLNSPIEIYDCYDNEEFITEKLGILTCANDLCSCKDILIEDSKKYNLDFKIYAYEGGAGYNYDFEVWSGKVITDKIIQFNDYKWECTNPSLGG